MASSPRPLTTTNQLSLSVDFPVLDEVWMKSYNLGPGSGFCHGASCSQGSSTLWQLSVPHSIFVAESYHIIWASHILFIHLGADGRLGWFIFWLLWLVLLWTGVHVDWLEHLLSVILGINLEVVEVLGRVVPQWLTLWRTTKQHTHRVSESESCSAHASLAPGTHEAHHPTPVHAHGGALSPYPDFFR